MLYPRVTTNGDLVCEDQMVGWREHLATKRILFLTGILSGETESHNLLMAMDSISYDPIRLVITSAGGELDSTFLFYDTMKMIKSPVETVGRYACSGAAILLAAGSKRYLFPHAKVMLHLVSGQAAGNLKEWEIHQKLMQGYQAKVVDILCECGAKKSRQQILADMDRDFWMEPQEAIDYGLCDEIMSPEVWQSWVKEEKK